MKRSLWITWGVAIIIVYYTSWLSSPHKWVVHSPINSKQQGVVFRCSIEQWSVRLVWSTYYVYIYILYIVYYISFIFIYLYILYLILYIYYMLYYILIFIYIIYINELRIKTSHYRRMPIQYGMQVEFIHTAHLVILSGNPTQHAGTSSLFHKKDDYQR